MYDVDGRTVAVHVAEIRIDGLFGEDQTNEGSIASGVVSGSIEPWPPYVRLL